METQHQEMNTPHDHGLPTIPIRLDRYLDPELFCHHELERFRDNCKGGGDCLVTSSLREKYLPDLHLYDPEKVCSHDDDDHRNICLRRGHCYQTEYLLNEYLNQQAPRVHRAMRGREERTRRRIERDRRMFEIRNINSP